MLLPMAAHERKVHGLLCDVSRS